MQRTATSPKGLVAPTEYIRKAVTGVVPEVAPPATQTFHGGEDKDVTAKGSAYDPLCARDLCREAPLLARACRGPGAYRAQPEEVGAEKFGGIHLTDQYQNQIQCEAHTVPPQFAHGSPYRPESHSGHWDRLEASADSRDAVLPFYQYNYHGQMMQACNAEISTTLRSCCAPLSVPHSGCSE